MYYVHLSTLFIIQGRDAHKLGVVCHTSYIHKMPAMSRYAPVQCSVCISAASIGPAQSRQQISLLLQQQLGWAGCALLVLHHTGLACDNTGLYYT